MKHFLCLSCVTVLFSLCVCVGARESAFRNVKSIAECLADELINAAKVSLKVYIIGSSCNAPELLLLFSL